LRAGSQFKEEGSQVCFVVYMYDTMNGVNENYFMMKIIFIIYSILFRIYFM